MVSWSERFSISREGPAGAGLMGYLIRQRSLAFRFLVLIFFLAGATLGRAIADTMIPPNIGIFAFYFPAVLLISILAGWQFGLLAILLSIVLTARLFLPQQLGGTTPAMQHYLIGLLFTVAASSQVALGQWLRSAMTIMVQAENRYRQLVTATSGIVWMTDADGQVHKPQTGWPEITGMQWPDYKGYMWIKCVHKDDRDRLKPDPIQIDENGQYQTEFRLWHAPTKDWRWFSSKCVPLRNANGVVREWITTLTDIHERKLAGERRELMIGELRHRLKNLFTVINSLMQSSRPRNEATVDLFISKLRGRIHALSTAADLAIATHRVSIDFGTMAKIILKPFLDDKAECILMDGPPLELSEETGGSLALALHELATNAIKYGALSTENGQVHLYWTCGPSVEGEQVVIEWEEKGGPVARAPSRGGFGSRIIKFSVARERASKVLLDYPEDGLICRFQFIRSATPPASFP